LAELLKKLKWYCLFETQCVSNYAKLITHHKPLSLAKVSWYVTILGPQWTMTYICTFQQLPS